ncbi:hypothetical protein KEM60_02537 [Austwickia sp. TVS 96-490-7B]|nr:hypothetical protein [Austwickia sp. TVS 96-490-7B]
MSDKQDDIHFDCNEIADPEMAKNLSSELALIRRICE